MQAAWALRPPARMKNGSAFLKSTRKGSNTDEASIQ
jgi:hypothetical protein